MSILPWDDWFYHLSKKHRQLNEDYNKYMRLRDEIELSGNAFNHKLDQLQVLVIYNTALLINLQMSTVSDVDYAFWLKEHEEPIKDIGRSRAVEAFRDINAFANGGLIAIAVKRFASKYIISGIKKAWGSISSRISNLGPGALEEALGETTSIEVEDAAVVAEDISTRLLNCGVDEAVATAAEGVGERVGVELAEGIVESSAKIFSRLALPELSNLAVVGGIFACVGIDAILGAIEGAIENHKLEKELSHMNNALKIVEEFQSNLRSNDMKIDLEISRTKHALREAVLSLDRIQPLPSDIGMDTFFSSDVDPPLETWISVFRQVAIFYGSLSTIRNNAVNYIANTKGEASYETFNFIMRMTMDKVQYPDNVLQALINYVADNSETLDSLRKKGVVVYGILPFDKWFYPSIDRKTKLLENLKSQYITGRAAAVELHGSLAGKVKIYSSMVAYNSTLLVAGMTLNASDDDFVTYVHTVENGIDDPPASHIPANVAKNISEAAGGLFALKALYNIGNVVIKELFGSVAEASGEVILEDVLSSISIEAGALGFSEVSATAVAEATAEVIAEAGVEAGVEAGLSAILPGVGIVVAIGIDAIIGIFDGKRRVKELEQGIRKVNSEILKVRNYTDKVKSLIRSIDDAVAKQEKNFVQLLQTLTRAATPNFNYVNLPDSQSYLDAMYRAVLQYGMITAIRKDWVNFLSNGGCDWDSFKQLELIQRPPHCDLNYLLTIIDIVHSLIENNCELW